jgi:cytoplasmic iron level regulating protein YaaA (DUF328/UPF0246 family)
VFIVLPPSETKRSGGAGGPLHFDALSWPAAFGAARRTALSAVTTLAADEEASRRALHLGPRQTDDVRKNREIAVAPTMSALRRYDGVLYRALGADLLDEAATRYAARHVAIHSALFGLVRAGDPIPDHRLSCAAHLPGLSLRTLWAAPVSAVLASSPGPVLDLRSKGYRRLGPPPERSDAAWVAVEDATGPATGHVNKHTKGVFIAALLSDRPAFRDLDDAVDWAHSAGFDMMRDGDGLHLRVALTRLRPERWL